MCRIGYGHCATRNGNDDTEHARAFDFESSRPMPLSFMPQKAAISVEIMIPSSIPTIPWSGAGTQRPLPRTRA
jgi:hypothetical protein